MRKTLITGYVPNEGNKNSIYYNKGLYDPYIF
jgi:hypothetical protein